MSEQSGQSEGAVWPPPPTVAGPTALPPERRLPAWVWHRFWGAVRFTVFCFLFKGAVAAYTYEHSLDARFWNRLASPHALLISLPVWFTLSLLIGLVEPAVSSVMGRRPRHNRSSDAD